MLFLTPCNNPTRVNDEMWGSYNRVLNKSTELELLETHKYDAQNVRLWLHEASVGPAPVMVRKQASQKLLL